MLFNSWAFVVFAPLAVAGNWLLRGRALRLWMVAASYVFYGWAEPWYCLLLVASTGLDFTVGLRLGSSTHPGVRRAWLAASVTGNLLLLGTFKYLGLLTSTTNDLFSWLGLSYQLPVPQLLLPVGISFYTFQTLSYTIDVYRGKTSPTRSFSQFALYVAFFPQLVAGPIERSTHLLPQLADRQPRTELDLLRGTSRIFWGLGKKIAFADPLGTYVGAVIADSPSMTSPELIVAVFAFHMQLYLDFSAYSDIAIGLAKTMGIDLRENFRWPFRSRNPAEYWRRWHISFSTWLRDYLFFSLGGSRGSFGRTLFNATLVFFLGGLWHGASWRFAFWGLYVGLFSALAQILGWLRGAPFDGDPERPFRLGHLPGALVTFLFFHTSAFLFVTESVAQWAEILRGCVTRWDGGLETTLLGEVVLRAGLVTGLCFVVHYVRGFRLTARLEATRSPYAHGALWAVSLVTIALLAPENTVRFIYFQF